jgi:glycosyltransferase involved in cell wall biosynthesis
MERVFAELIRRAHRDYRLVVVSRELDPDLRPLVEWHRVRIPGRPRPLHFVLFYVLAGVRLTSITVDLVHTLGALVPNRADLASVHFCHAGFLAARRRGADGRRPMARRINTRIAHVLGLWAERWSYGRGRIPTLASVSVGVGREIERHYAGARVFLTPNGVDTARFRPDPAARRVLRSREGLDDSEIVALFVGGDWDHKGLGIAIEALAHVQLSGCPAPRLWVVGEGDEKRFRAYAVQRGMGGRVRFFGTQRNAERFYQASDVFVLPSLYESFSLVSFEAAACGVPVLAAKVHGVDELVGKNEGGLVIERTPEAFGAALAELASDPERRARMGEAARRRASTYTWERSTASVVEIYRKLLGGAHLGEEAA